MRDDFRWASRCPHITQCSGLQGLSQELEGHQASSQRPNLPGSTFTSHVAKLLSAPSPSHISSSSSASFSSLLLLLLLAVSGSLYSALKTVPFTARTGKRSSRLFCDVSFNEESPL